MRFIAHDTMWVATRKANLEDALNTGVQFKIYVSEVYMLPSDYAECEWWQVEDVHNIYDDLIIGIDVAKGLIHVIADCICATYLLGGFENVDAIKYVIARPEGLVQL